MIAPREPLLHGGGSPLKFIEALAHGLPVIATAHSSRLLEDGRTGEDFVRDAARPGASHPGAAMTRHHDEVRFAHPGLLQDVLRHRLREHRRTGQLKSSVVYQVSNIVIPPNVICGAIKK